MIDPVTRRQIVRFVVSGVLATGADAAVYFSLVHSVLAHRHDPSKAVSFVVGTLVAYVLNKYWTFEAPGRDARQMVSFFALYGASFTVNVGMNHGLLQAAHGAGLAPVLSEAVAFVGATATSMVLNFVGQRLWVFRADRS